MDIMAAVSHREGLSKEELESISEFEASQLFDEKDRAVLRYTAEMTKTPVDVPDELFAELQAHFSDEQIIKLTAEIAWENFRARMNHALGNESAGFMEGASCKVPGKPTATH